MLSKTRRDAQFRVARDRDIRQCADRVLPHLRPDFLQAQYDVQQTATLQTQGARPRTQGPQIQKAAHLLVFLGKRDRVLALDQTSGEVGLTLEIVFLHVVPPEEGNPQSLGNRCGIDARWVSLFVEGVARAVPELDIIPELSLLLLGELRDGHLDRDSRCFTLNRPLPAPVSSLRLLHVSESCLPTRKLPSTCLERSRVRQ